MTPGLPVLLPAEPARSAVAAFAASRGLRVSEVADVLGFDRVALNALLHCRWVHWGIADAIAVALGLHPCELWPDWFSPMPAALLDGCVLELGDRTI